MRNYMIFIFASLFVVLFFFLLHRPGHSLLTEDPDATVLSPPAATRIVGSDFQPGIPRTSPVHPRSPVPSPALSPISKNSPLRNPLTFPNLEDLRAEALSNPHGPPPSLLNFAASLGEKMEAIQNETDANYFLNELNRCVVSPENRKSTSVQALCLTQARELGARFPGLEPSFRDLENRSAPEVQRLARIFR